MTAIRALVIEVLDEVAGIRSNAAFADALRSGGDMALAMLDLDSLARFEAIMLIEEALGIELDDDELLEQQTLNRLVTFLETRAAPDLAPPLAPGSATLRTD
jgi:acyl carrier protein